MIQRGPERGIITVNQRETVVWRANLTVAELLAELNYTYPHIIVSINGVLTPHDDYAITLIPDGADVRLVHLIAGG